MAAVVVAGFGHCSFLMKTGWAGLSYRSSQVIFTTILAWIPGVIVPIPVSQLTETE